MWGDKESSAAMLSNIRWNPWHNFIELTLVKKRNIKLLICPQYRDQSYPVKIIAKVDKIEAKSQR